MEIQSKFILFYIISLRCKTYFLTLTDFSVKDDDKERVFISGEVHGNEKVGPEVAIELADFLLKNHL